MGKKVNLTFNTISEYQREISVLNKRIAALGGNSKIHGTTLNEYKKRFVIELLYAKELKKQGKFN